MRPPRPAALLACLVLFSPTNPAHAQGTKEDYARAEALRAKTRDKVFRSGVRPHWFADNAKFWYRNDLPDGAREFIVVDAARGERGPAFDHARLAEGLAKVLGEPVAG